MHVEEHDTGHGKEMYQQVDSCWALGDCCANMELPLPALAQVGPPSQASTVDSSAHSRQRAIKQPCCLGLLCTSSLPYLGCSSSGVGGNDRDVKRLQVPFCRAVVASLR